MRKQKGVFYKKAGAVLLCIACAVSCMGCGDRAAESQDVVDRNADEYDDLPVVEDSEYNEDTEATAETEEPVEVISDKDAWVTETLAEMTLEEKVCQMFMVTPECITGYTTVIAAGSVTQEALAEYPVGGMIYFASNLQDTAQTREMLGNTAEYARANHDIPIFLSVDEEGGRVARVAGNGAFGIENIGPMRTIGDSGDLTKAYDAGDTLGSYLSELGFNLDYAPDADVITNPANTVIGDRSFGTDPQCVSDMMLQVADGLWAHQVVPCVKHFPGHGSTEGDTHEGLAYTNKTLEELKESELVPFQTAVDHDLPMIMVSHISVPNILGDNTPSSLSYEMVTGLLREQMGYDGIIITDGMGMGAIADHYESGEAAVLAVQAGCDMLLLTNDFEVAYQAVLSEVENGTISEQQINDSVERILRVKYDLR